MKQPVEESNVVVGSGKRSLFSWRPTKKQVSITFIILCVLIAAGAAAYIFVKKSSTEKPIDSAQFVCKDDLLQRANTALGNQESVDLKTTNASTLNAQSTADVSALSKISLEIMSKQNYSKDFNCLYILTEYYIQAGDLISAQKTLAQIEVLTLAQKGNDAISYNTKKIESLKSGVAALQKQADLLKQNSVYGKDYRHPEGYTNPNTGGTKP